MKATTNESSGGSLGAGVQLQPQVQITTNGVFIFATLRSPAPKVLLLLVNLKLLRLIG